MTEEKKVSRRKEKLLAVKAFVEAPENAPDGYTVRSILARGGLVTTVRKKE